MMISNGRLGISDLMANQSLKLDQNAYGLRHSQDACTRLYKYQGVNCLRVTQDVLNIYIVHCSNPSSILKGERSSPE